MKGRLDISRVAIVSIGEKIWKKKKKEGVVQ